MRAGEALVAKLKGEANPVMAWGNRPMLPHVMRQGTADFPNKELQERVAADGGERRGAVATLFTGFPHADIRNAGLQRVVVTDGDVGRAQTATATNCSTSPGRTARPSSTRSSRWTRVDGTGEGRSTEGPVVLLDHYDNAASGGTMDTTTVLRAILDAGLDDVAAFAIYDPEAVQPLIAAGVGKEVTLPLGGKMDMPPIGLTGEPLTVTGRVKLISDGLYRNLRTGLDRHADGYGADRRARHREGRDRRDLAASGTE